MSDRDWLRYFFAFLAAATLVAWAFLTQPNEPSALESDSEAEQTCPSEQYKIGAGSGDGPSLTISRYSPSCEEKAEAEDDAKSTKNRSLTTAEADLLAQERMAHWTKWIGIFTSAGLAVLFVTFDATRAAVIETRKIGIAQVRPYLALQAARTIPAQNRQFCVVAQIVNNGASSARIVGASGIIEKYPRVSADEEASDAIIKSIEDVRWPSDIPARESRQFEFYIFDPDRAFYTLERWEAMRVEIVIELKIFDKIEQLRMFAETTSINEGVAEMLIR